MMDTTIELDPGDVAADRAADLLLCTFSVGGTHFAVDALQVQEVLRSQPMSEAPLSPPEVCGLINLRGQILTAIDLRCRLGLPPGDEVEDPMNVVVRTDEGAVSFLVDEIGDVVELEAGALLPAPDAVGHIDRDLILGIHQMDTGLLVVLDVAAIARPMARP